MVRASILGLIYRMRGLVGDTGDTEQFSDDDYAAALDANCTRVRQAPLTPVPTVQAGGVTVYLIWESPGFTWWGTDAIIQDGATWATLTATTADYATGTWTFATHQASPVYVTGESFNLYAAAADMLETWAMTLAGEYDFSADGASFKRSQMAAGKSAAAGRLRAMGGPARAEMYA